jgi:hypothetical protein
VNQVIEQMQKQNETEKGEKLNEMDKVRRISFYMQKTPISLGTR